jgi:4-aminobutyrate aminotransferase
MTHLAPVWFQVTDLPVETGHGSWVVTTDGTEYLDFTAGIAVTSTGHCHPHVVEAIRRQAGRFIHAQVNCYRHDLLEPLAERLAEVTPPSIDTFFYANSGAEATEGALKLARQATGRPNAIVFSGSFHGRTHQTMAMTTSKTSYRAGHMVLPAGIFVAPFPHWQATGETEAAATARCLDGLRHLLAAQTAPSETAAMFLEPVLGEGGYLPAPEAFIRGVVDICREFDILFVADEVQSGFGRTGRWFAVDHHGIDPDILVMAKGIASGFPISAIGASAALMARWPTGSHGGTYGGNPIGCAAAIATIEVMSEPGFLENVEQRGVQLRDGLAELQSSHPVIRDVRGLGLMNGVELYHEGSGLPAGDRVAAIASHCREQNRLLLMNAGTYGNILRWMPPLVVTEAEIAQGLKAFGEALDATA